ncbi:Organic hydroperoxide resistance protein [Fulvia fulva]|uniref:Organic hydroperoxide resistance protein n=1 Tax=Passalora fulva TaxID=5499 RepID=A0A9Q8P389_PASFU|nr:Organic hydroperoxide resistance protein [Fulvia fulva]KAK4635381.1 Organic hydroperoxide resistance protein [Fulvia fulva]KAK4638340.1 Organic hydroperoxide resistance protein [Fulvia fulva]UJO11549.1 Organic hydroperoxide resistance protein [Fulvia fulva]WPV09340.1 Organic hydroperoxide resistance protein [Fulvia fulva]WPV23863.1 Organic hydroperoxide resistance protein [Fulvia fulva]
MASIRTLRPLLRSAPRLTTLTPPTKRFLNWSSDAPLTTAQATVTGGRQGHATSPHFDFDLGMPTNLGGDGKKTNPEELFAAGYGACFQGAMGATAPSLGLKNPESTIETDVHLIGDLKKLDLGIRVDMKITGKDIKLEDLKKLVEKTKTVCPYSRATEGNVTTNIEVAVE